ncbi:MAG: geranylgeranyl reductase family protein [Actinomycetota bacterium]|nr:geranylgeranyl reductase family protein [Actinomycetota bacterium]
MEYDVVVVGAGPAGASTAYHLAKRDVNVLLIDKCNFPREKICGDGIAPRAVRNLYKMGLQERLDGNFLKFGGFIFGGAGRAVVKREIPPTPRFPDHGYIIRRIDFDKLLLDYSRENGVEVLEGTKVIAPLVEDGKVFGVKALRNGEEIEICAKVVVGADGAHSVLGRKMGLLLNNPQYLGIAIRQYFEGVEEVGRYLEVYPDRVITPASGWVFPLGGSVANVGVGAMLYQIQKKKIDLHEYFQKFITESAIVFPKLRNAKPISPLRGALLRVGLGGSKVECPGLILVGDAASMTNPVSGEGITYALETGEMAAEHILESRMSGRGIHHDPEEDSFREKLLSKYFHYFRTGIRSIRWGDRPIFMRPLLSVVSKSEKRSADLVRALMYLRH